MLKQSRELIQVKNNLSPHPFHQPSKQLFGGNKGERKGREQGAWRRGWFKSALLTKAVFIRLCPVDLATWLTWMCVTLEIC